MLTPLKGRLGATGNGADVHTPQPGDYACVQIKWIHKRIFGKRIKLPNIMGLLIRLFTFSEYDHCFIYTGKGQIIEARPSGASRGSLSEYEGCKIQWSTTPTTFTERGGVMEAAIRCAGIPPVAGVPYGYRDIIFLALSVWGWRPSWLLSQVLREDRMICSQLVAFCGETAGINAWMCGQVFAQVVTPGLLAKLAEGHVFPS